MITPELLETTCMLKCRSWMTDIICLCRKYKQTVCVVNGESLCSEGYEYFYYKRAYMWPLLSLCLSLPLVVVQRCVRWTVAAAGCATAACAAARRAGRARCATRRPATPCAPRTASARKASVSATRAGPESTATLVSLCAYSSDVKTVVINILLALVTPVNNLFIHSTPELCLHVCLTLYHVLSY